MPLPLVAVWALMTASAAATGAGVGAASDARKKNKEAEKIINRAKEKWEQTKKSLEREESLLKNKLESFGKAKVDIFENLIGDFLRLVKDCANSASSKVSVTKYKYISKKELRKLEKERLETLNIVNNGIEGITKGAGTAGGIYSLVGMFGSASTGTAISSLGGAAATNSTLAWLGGGSLAAGGGGIALGTTVLGGLFAGPAIAIMGLTMDSKAEENLTKAKEFEAEAEKKIEIMKKSIEEIKIVGKYIDESILILNTLKQKYFTIKEILFSKQERVYRNLLKNRANHAVIIPPLCQLEDFDFITTIVKSIKEILEGNITDDEGKFNMNFKTIIDERMKMIKGDYL